MDRFRLVCLGLAVIIGSNVFSAEDQPQPLPENQRPGPLVEVQPRQTTMPKFTAYLSNFEDGHIDVLMLDGREKKTLTVDEVASMKFVPQRPPNRPDSVRRDPPEDAPFRPGLGGGELRERGRFWELLMKHDRDLSEQERLEYQKLRGKFNLPDRGVYVEARNEARRAQKAKELPAYIEKQRKALKATPVPTADESRLLAVALIYAYDAQKMMPREIIDKLEGDLPALPPGLEPRMKRKNLLNMAVWDILNHGPETPP